MNSEHLTDFVITGLSKHRSPNDIVIMICEKSGMPWQDAQEFVSKVQNDHQNEISSKSSSVPALLSLIIILIVGIGGLIGVAGWLGLPKSLTSKGWPTVEGVIVSSELIESMCWGSDGDLNTCFDINVSYRYSVNGKQYTSDAVTSIDRVSIVNDARYEQEIIRRYPVGREVMVYYNPRTPYDALLEPGIILKPALDTLVPILFGLMCSASIVGLIALSMFQFKAGRDKR